MEPKKAEKEKQARSEMAVSPLIKVCAGFLLFYVNIPYLSSFQDTLY